MDGMNMDNGSMGANGSMMMPMTFSSTMTPLYSTAWQPTTTAGYAGTCIFLIMLGVLFRGLLALKAWKEAAWLDTDFNRRYVVVAGRPTKAEDLQTDPHGKRMILTENGAEEEVMVVKKRGLDVRPWRLTVDPLRAVMDTFIAGVGYLLMLAVMTLNVGYFASVLGGIFLGSLVIGRYAIAFEHN